ncbi:hypothetical protein Tco_0132602 [Tanacetum coccineum]
MIIIYYVWQERNRKLFNNCKKSVDLFGILYEEIRAKMVSITVKQTAKVLRAETVWNIKFARKQNVHSNGSRIVGLPYCEVAAAVRVDCLHEGNVTLNLRILTWEVVTGDEDDSDTEEEVKEEEAIGKLAPPVSNQVEATT